MTTTTSTPPWAPDAAEARGAAVTGAEGHLTTIRVRIENGLDSFTVTGLPGGGVPELRDRVRAAVVNSGLTWPSRAIAAEVAPAGLRGCGMDLPLAVAVLAADGEIPAEAAGSCVLIAELGLDGRLREVRGVVPAVAAAAAAGYPVAVVAPGNAGEAVSVAGVSVVPCESLRAVVAWLGGRLPALPAWLCRQAGAGAASLLSGLPQVLLALQAAAAGGHHLCLTGPPGSAAGGVAAGMRFLLPAPGAAEAREVRAVWSAAGIALEGDGPDLQVPWRAPHHTVTMAQMAGGGSGIARPGEAALAHGGVLFLHQAPEFSRQVLTGLRQPLTYGHIQVVRGGLVTRFPARFTLIAAMNPCPCPEGCGCSPLAARRYRARFDEALGSFIGIRVPVTPGEPAETVTAGPSAWADQVADARDRARRRYRGRPWTRNADVPAAELARSWPAGTGALAEAGRLTDLGRISRRGAARVARLAWTLADLAGQPRPGDAECGQALRLYLGSG
jgi:magnesium chelatase family protein